MEHTNKNPHSVDQQQETNVLVPNLHPEHVEGSYVNTSVLDTIIVIEAEIQKELYPEVEVPAEENFTNDEIDALVATWVRVPLRSTLARLRFQEAVKNKEFWTVTIFSLYYIKNRTIVLLSGPAELFYSCFCVGIVGCWADAVDRYEKFKHELGRGRAQSLLGGFREQLTHYVQFGYKRQGLRSFLVRMVDAGSLLVFFSPVQVYMFGVLKMAQHKVQPAGLAQVSAQQKLTPVLLESGQDQLMIDPFQLSGAKPEPFKFSTDTEEYYSDDDDVPNYIDNYLGFETDDPNTDAQKYTLDILNYQEKKNDVEAEPKQDKKPEKPEKTTDLDNETLKKGDKEKKADDDGYDGWCDDNQLNQNADWNDEWDKEEEETFPKFSRFDHTYIDEEDREEDEDETGERKVDGEDTENGDENRYEGANGYDDDEDDDDNGYDDGEEDDDDEDDDDNGYDDGEEDDDNGYDDDEEDDEEDDGEDGEGDDNDYDDDDNGYDDDDDETTSNTKLTTEDGVNGDATTGTSPDKKTRWSPSYDPFPREIPIPRELPPTFGLGMETLLATFTTQVGEADQEDESPNRTGTFTTPTLFHPDEAWALVPATKSNAIRSFLDKKAGNKYDGSKDDPNDLNCTLVHVDENFGQLRPALALGKRADVDSEEQADLETEFGAFDLMVEECVTAMEEKKQQKPVSKKHSGLNQYKANTRLSTVEEPELEPGEEEEEEEMDEEFEVDGDEEPIPSPIELETEEIWLMDDDDGDGDDDGGDDDDDHDDDEASSIRKPPKGQQLESLRLVDMDNARKRLSSQLTQLVAKRRLYHSDHEGFALASLPPETSITGTEPPVQGYYGNIYYSGSVPGHWHERLELPLYATDEHPSLLATQEIKPRSHYYTVNADARVTNTFFSQLAMNTAYGEGDAITDILDPDDVLWYETMYDEDGEESEAGMGSGNDSGDEEEEDNGYDDEDDDDNGYDDDDDDDDNGYDDDDDEDDNGYDDDDDEDDNDYDEDDNGYDEEDDDEEDGTDDGQSEYGENNIDETNGDVTENSLNTENENTAAQNLENFEANVKQYSSAFIIDDDNWYTERVQLQVELEALADLNKPLMQLETKVDLLARPVEIFSSVFAHDPITRVWVSPSVAFITGSWCIVFTQLIYRTRKFCRKRKWKNREEVFTKSIHVARDPRFISLPDLPGGYGENTQLTRLLNAFEAKRGEQLYKPNIVISWWENHILPYAVLLSPALQNWVLEQQTKTTSPVREQSTGKPTFTGPEQLNVRLRFLQGDDEQPVTPRITLSEDINAWQAKMITQWSSATHSHNAQDQNRHDWETKFIRCINTIGYSAPLMYAERFTQLVSQELRNLVPLAMIHPGGDRLDDLPKGLLLSGPNGNGRELFVRALAGDARLPLFVTESNRFSEDKWGLIRLMLAFRHARSYAPSILFLRGLDMITYDRKQNRKWRSLRMTTQFLLNMDGYYRSYDEHKSKRHAFVLGTVTTARTMDPACLRSGRFEWVIEFRNPFPDERAQMLENFATFSQIETSDNVNWSEVSLATKGYSINDLRFVLNNAALNELYQGNKVCTRENLNHAIGLMNILQHRSMLKAEKETKTTVRRDFFAVQATEERESPKGNESLTHLLINDVYVQKKILQYLRLIIGQPDSATKLAANWMGWDTNPPKVYQREDAPERQQQRLFMEGVSEFIAEMLFLRDFEQASCSPMMVFDTYSHTLAIHLASVYLPMYETQKFGRSLSSGTFIRQFNRCGKKQPHNWTTLSYRSFRLLGERFEYLDKWYIARRFQFKTSKLQRSIAEHFTLPGSSPKFETIQNTDRDIRNLYEDNADLSVTDQTVGLMLKKRLIERNNVEYEKMLYRAHLEEVNMFGTFQFKILWRVRAHKRVVRLKQVAQELLKLRQLRD